MAYLLSPAGSPAALKAAINAGADEVYLGGADYNARMNASNFDRNALVSASKLCRNANVAMHITLNTLIYDKEFKGVLEYIDFLANDVRPDALIVQDLGLACVIRREFPDISLHASTQMRIHSPDDAEFLKSLGFTRAVLARELPKEDIAAFVKTGLETEIFVHGAICVSESGGCLMSSVIGGRSGNRGECAQPCRLPYSGKNRYPLSLKDVCLANHIPELLKIGVTSLKIEGRMKSPEYVGVVTSVYRRLIDENRCATEEERKLLSNVFSRSGFTDGYFTSRINRDMFGIRREEDKKQSSSFTFSGYRSERRAEKPLSKTPSTLIMPERNDEKTLHPSKQKGFVLRFEGKLPSKSFFDKYAEKAARIDVPLDAFEDKRLKPYLEKVSVVMPRSVFASEKEAVTEQLGKAYEQGIRNATLSSLNQISLCERFYLHGDYAFNVVNRETISFLESLSFASVMISPETDGRFPRGSKCALEYIGYGRTPLMYTRTCILANINGCNAAERNLCRANNKNGQCFGTLTDRTGARFPIITSKNHTNVIYNSLPGYRIDKRSELKKCGIGLITILFTDENEQRMESVMKLIENPTRPDFEYTRR